MNFVVSGIAVRASGRNTSSLKEHKCTTTASMRLADKTARPRLRSADRLNRPEGHPNRVVVRTGYPLSEMSSADIRSRDSKPHSTHSTLDITRLVMEPSWVRANTIMLTPN